MNRIKTKIYYLVSTGEVLVVTPEYKGYGVQLTEKEQDMNLYKQLSSKKLAEIDYIELEYGTLESTFNNAKSYKVNLETKKLEVIYYTKEEAELIDRQRQEIEKNSYRVSDVSTYLLNSDDITISNIENSILEIERNKILEGMI